MTMKMRTIRIGDDLLSRVDAVASNRSEFIRAAIEICLDALDAQAVRAVDLSHNEIFDDIPMKVSGSPVHHIKIGGLADGS